MEIFKRIIPAYKSAGTKGPRAPSSTCAQPAGLFESLFSMFGGKTPAYKSADGTQALSSSPSMLGGLFSTSPAYKTAQVGEVELAEEAAFVASNGDEGFVCERAPDEVILL